MNFNRKQFKLTDKIKYKREYGKKSDKLRYIKSHFDIKCKKKTESFPKDGENRNQIKRRCLIKKGDSSYREFYIGHLIYYIENYLKIYYRL